MQQIRNARTMFMCLFIYVYIYIMVVVYVHINDCVVERWRVLYVLYNTSICTHRLKHSLHAFIYI